MTIPTLRILGLIVGRNDKIRLVSNGEIIVESEKLSMIDRVIRTVLLEIDFRKFCFIKLLKETGQLTRSDILSSYQNTNIGDKQLKERINSWLNLLKQSGLVDEDDEKRISAKYNNIKKATEDLEVKKKEPDFIRLLLDGFSSLRKYGTAGMIDIVDLRSEVALKYLRENHLILTENQFDLLLRKTPKVTNSYILTFGQPMGAEEQLFTYRRSYYRTINIKLLKGELDQR